MSGRRRCCPMFLILLVVLSFRLISFAQDDPKESDGNTKVTTPDKKTQKPIADPRQPKVMQLEIDLQNAPNSMEPVAEPRRIRIDDRAYVQFLLTNLSPLDVCSRNPGTPTPTAETPVAESVVATIAKLGGFPVGEISGNLSAKFNESVQMMILATPGAEAAPPPPACKVEKVESDPEYSKILARSKDFFAEACGLIGGATPDQKCNDEPNNQVELAREIDSATEKLANYAGMDYRGKYQSAFAIADNNGSDLVEVRKSFTMPLKSIASAGNLQAMADEMTTWALDLHKKYDYTVPAGDSGSPASPPLIAGALTVSPTSLSFALPNGIQSPAIPAQVVQLSAGGQAGAFTATPTSDTGWLLLAKPGPIPPSLSGDQRHCPRPREFHTACHS